MNRTRGLVALFIVAGITAALVVLAAPAAATRSAVTSKDTHVVRVYYFHTTQRCASCKKIEALTEEAIRAGFGEELAAGNLEWQLINTDEAPNRHFIKDYQLYTKSVVVVDLVNGQQERWKNLPKIWELLNDPAAFGQYVRQEVRAYLDKRS